MGYGEWQFFLIVCNTNGCGDSAVATVDVESATSQRQRQVSGEQATSGDLNRVPVGNLDVGHSADRGTRADQAQAFTTGAHAGGCRLTSINLQYSSIGTAQPSCAVKVCAGSESTPCTTEMGAPTKPAALARGANTFPAARGGIDLSASNTYWVVVGYSALGTGHLVLARASNFNENAEEDSGWSMADNGVIRSSTSTRSNL